MSAVCSYCGRAMEEKGLFCNDCLNDEYACYRAVKDYLRKNPNSNAMQIANQTGISVSKIIDYIRNGSLSVVEPETRRRRT